MIEQLIVDRFPLVALLLAVGISTLLLIRNSNRPGGRSVWINPLVAFCVSYVIMVLTMKGLSAYIEWRLNSFDTDGNGMFTDNEQVGAWEYFFDIYARDTARTFIIYTGVIFAGMSVAVGYVLTLAYRAAARLKS